MPEEASALYYWGTQGSSYRIPPLFCPLTSSVHDSLCIRPPANILTIAPLRFCFSIFVLFYTYFFGPSSPIFSSGGGPSSRNGIHSSSNGSSSGNGSSRVAATDGLKNRVLFTFMFFEMLSWFWIWVTVREERPAVVDRVRKSRKREMQYLERD
jgi:hypothetical protein